jgi:hypothetical protein
MCAVLLPPGDNPIAVNNNNNNNNNIILWCFSSFLSAIQNLKEQ